MTTHTDLAAQAREMATTLRSIAIPAQYERNAASLLEQCAAALSTERLAGGGELLEFLTMTEAQVDDELRRLGIDPVLAIEMGANAVARTLISYTCRLCGHSTPHTDTAEEILIFRNGMKAARAIKPQAERVPLSPSRLADRLEGVDYTPSCRRAFIDGVRFAEIAHSIGTPKEST